MLLIGPLGTNFSEILIGIQTFSFKKTHLKMSSAKWRPFCLGLNVLKLPHIHCNPFILHLFQERHDLFCKTQFVFTSLLTESFGSLFDHSQQVNLLSGAVCRALDSGKSYSSNTDGLLGKQDHIRGLKLSQHFNSCHVEFMSRSIKNIFAFYIVS